MLGAKAITDASAGEASDFNVRQGIGRPPDAEDFLLHVLFLSFGLRARPEDPNSGRGKHIDSQGSTQISGATNMGEEPSLAAGGRYFRRTWHVGVRLNHVHRWTLRTLK